MEQTSEQQLTMKIDGRPVSDQEFQEAMNNPQIKLIELAPGEYKTLSRLEG
jgi:hypothetical protein